MRATDLPPMAPTISAMRAHSHDSAYPPRMAVINLALWVQIRAWVTCMAHTISAYSEDDPPAWVGAMHAELVEYNKYDSTDRRYDAIEQLLMENGEDLHDGHVPRLEGHGRLTPDIAISHCSGDIEVEQLWVQFEEHITGPDNAVRSMLQSDATLPSGALRPILARHGSDAFPLPRFRRSADLPASAASSAASSPSFGAELHLQRARRYARASARFGFDDRDVPAPFLCAISFQMMRVPFVVYSQDARGVVYAHSYERAAILRWSKNNGTNPVNGLRAIGGAVNLTLLVKICAWITYCSAALSAYTEDAAPAWVGSLRDLVAQYVAPVDAVSDDETELSLGTALEPSADVGALVRPVYNGEWKPTPCAARAEVHGPFGRIVLVQSMSSGSRRKTRRCPPTCSPCTSP